MQLVQGHTYHRNQHPLKALYLPMLAQILILIQLHFVNKQREKHCYYQRDFFYLNSSNKTIYFKSQGWLRAQLEVNNQKKAKDLFDVSEELEIGREPWSSGYGKRLTFQGSWVRIQAPDTGWTWHFSYWIVVKIALFVWKKTENKRKRGRGWPIIFFKKKSCHNLTPVQLRKK